MTSAIILEGVVSRVSRMVSSLHQLHEIYKITVNFYLLRFRRGSADPHDPPLDPPLPLLQRLQWEVIWEPVASMCQIPEERQSEQHQDSQNTGSTLTSVYRKLMPETQLTGRTVRMRSQ